MGRTDLRALLDRFTTVDQDIQGMHEELASLLRENNQMLGQVIQSVGNIDIPDGGGGGAGNRTFPWDASTVVTAGTDSNSPIETERTIDYDGKITQVLIGWTEGSQQAVGANLTTADGEQLIPRNDPSEAQFIGLDDHVLTVPLNYEFSDGDTFVAKFINNDQDNDHFVNFIMLAEEYE